MRFLEKTLIIMLAMFSCFALEAQAVTITFDYQVPSDGSGKTSINGVNANNVALPGFIIETFDQPNSPGGTITTTSGGSITIAPGGGFNTLDPTKLDVSGGLGIRQGSVSGVAATPAGDTTFFAFGPGPNSGTSNSTIKIENSNFYAYQPGLFVWYLGLYYGSIDTYNNIAFFSGNDLLTTGSGLLSDGILTGSEVLASQGGSSGNQFQPGSNVYVNIFFEPNEIFTAFEFRTTGIAFELDNVVAGVRPIQEPVPEPSTILLLGLGLVGFTSVARKKMNK